MLMVMICWLLLVKSEQAVKPTNPRKKKTRSYMWLRSRKKKLQGSCCKKSRFLTRTKREPPILGTGVRFGKKEATKYRLMSWYEFYRYPHLHMQFKIKKEDSIVMAIQIMERGFRKRLLADMQIIFLGTPPPSSPQPTKDRDGNGVAESESVSWANVRWDEIGQKFHCNNQDYLPSNYSRVLVISKWLPFKTNFDLRAEHEGVPDTMQPRSIMSILNNDILVRSSYFANLGSYMCVTTYWIEPVSKLAKSQDIKSGKFLVGFSSSLSNRGKEDLHSFHSFSARGEARPTTNEGGKLALLAVALFLGLEHGSFIHLLMNSQLRQKQRRGGPRPGKGRVAEWSKAADCKSVEVFLRRFESCLSHLFVVDFREEKRGIRQRRKANRAKLLWPFREVQLYRMLVREVGELLRSIDSPSISNPNENRSE
ncbi:hypothetical protein Tco_0312106 [Tanacetum coccineum]